MTTAILLVRAIPAATLRPKDGGRCCQSPARWPSSAATEKAVDNLTLVRQVRDGNEYEAISIRIIYSGLRLGRHLVIGLSPSELCHA